MSGIRIPLPGRHYRDFPHLILFTRCDGCGKYIFAERGTAAPIELLLSDGSHVPDEIVLCGKCSRETVTGESWPEFEELLRRDPDKLPF